jgi:hypothetical protein
MVDDYGQKIEIADQEHDDMVTSNFIEMLKEEKFVNKSDEFRKVFKGI